MYGKKCIQVSLVLLVVFIFATFFGPNYSLAAERKAVTWGTTSSSSGLYALFVMTAKIFNDNIPEINVTVRSTGANVHNVRLSEKGEIDIGVVDTRTAVLAIQGKAPFEGKPFPDLRLLYAITGNNALQFVVSEKSGVKDIYGLEGKPFTPGMLGSSTEMHLQDFFRALGVHPKIRHSSYADAIEMMKNEVIVGFGKAVAPDASILEIMSAMKIKILSLSDEDIEKIQKNTPGLAKVVLPSGIYPGIGEIKTVESQYCVFVKKDFPTEFAYKILKAVWENRKELKRMYSSSSGDHLTDVVKTRASVYLHPGAIKYFRELGLTVPKTLVPPEMGEK